MLRFFRVHLYLTEPDSCQERSLDGIGSRESSFPVVTEQSLALLFCYSRIPFRLLCFSSICSLPLPTLQVGRSGVLRHGRSQAATMRCLYSKAFIVGKTHIQKPPTPKSAFRPTPALRVWFCICHPRAFVSPYSFLNILLGSYASCISCGYSSRFPLVIFPTFWI